MVYRVEIFRDNKGIVVLQFLIISHLSVIPGRIYDITKLKKWMCELCTFSQIRSYVCLCVCPPPRLSITSGVMWCDIDPIRLVE